MIKMSIINEMSIAKLKAVLNNCIESRSCISLHPSFNDIDAQMALCALERLEQIASDTQNLLDLANSAEKWKGLALAKHGDGLVSQIEQDKAAAVAAEREACAKVCELERYAFEQNKAVWESNPEFMPEDSYIDEWDKRATDNEWLAAEIRARGRTSTKEQA